MDTSKFVVLEASAGSGKTHNLTKRYIELLLNFNSDKKENIRIQNILALTFANKATVEMKERIIDNLKKIRLKLTVAQKNAFCIMRYHNHGSYRF